MYKGAAFLWNIKVCMQHGEKQTHSLMPLRNLGSVFGKYYITNMNFLTRVPRRSVIFVSLLNC